MWVSVDVTRVAVKRTWMRTIVHSRVNRELHEQLE
jgi:hypothetical protein